MKILAKQRLTAAPNPMIAICIDSLSAFLEQFSYLKPFKSSVSQTTIDSLFE